MAEPADNKYLPIKRPGSQDLSFSINWKWYLKMIFFFGGVVGLFILNIQTMVFTKTVQTTEPIKLKYILIWTPRNTSPFNYFKTGQKVFVESQCPDSNCYFSDRKKYSDSELVQFDAVIFNGRNFARWKRSYMPKIRAHQQKYIFFNMESADNQPLCSPVFDGTFNLTATYKLTSDIVYSYIVVKNKAGEEVGPRIDMKWEEDKFQNNDTFLQSLSKKSKAAAWFVSHCKTRSKREKYAQQLKRELKRFNLTLDIFGKCGEKSYPRNKCRESDCTGKLLRDNYYFYLSFENSFSEDYVTEKLLTALQGDAVPIVYGGANYSRFLPPGSYLDARKHKPDKLATIMARLISLPTEYHSYFRWNSYYTYHKPDNLCRLCAVLNNLNTTNYKNFRKWWLPNYGERCKHPAWGS